MRGEVITRDASDESVPEKNISVAIRQGRISEVERGRWIDAYAKQPYETVTQNLLSRRPSPTASAAPEQSASEEAIRAYLIQTHAIPPWESR